MAASWQNSFDNGAAGFLTAAETDHVIQLLAATILLLWAAWMFLHSYQEFGRGVVSAGQMFGLWVRTVFWLTALLYLFLKF